MKLLSQTTISKVNGKVTPTISEKGIGLTAGKTYDATIETIERIFEHTENSGRTAWTTKNTATDVIVTVTTDKGEVGRFGSEFFCQVN